MLNGVAHDLRTILTRFKLSLAVMEQDPDVEALQNDVDEMSRMLEAYLAFARGDTAEQSAPTDIAALLEQLRTDAQRQGHADQDLLHRRPVATVRPDAFRRCSPISSPTRTLRRRIVIAGQARRATSRSMWMMTGRASGRQARRRIPAVPPARRGPQPGPCRLGPRPRHRPRHRPRPWRRRHLVQEPARRPARHGARAALGAQMPPSEQPGAVRNRSVRRRQHDRAVLVGKAQRQHLGHELADLARREIHHGRDLPAGQRLRL